jgi:hypothetical protein
MNPHAYEMTRNSITDLANEAKSSLSRRDFVNANSCIKEARLMIEIYQKALKLEGIKEDWREIYDLRTLISPVESLIVKAELDLENLPVPIGEMRQVQIMILERRIK